MRSLSEGERAIVNSLFSSANNSGFVYNYIFEHQADESWTFDSERGEIKLGFPYPTDAGNKRFEEVTKRFETIQILVLEIGNLLHYLEENSLIYCYQATMEARLEKVESLASAYIDGKNVLYAELPDRTVNSRLMKYFNMKIYCTQELRDLVRNKFKQKEDVRLDRSIRKANIALIVAILMGLISIAINTLKLLMP